MSAAKVVSSKKCKKWILLHYNTLNLSFCGKGLFNILSIKTQRCVFRYGNYSRTRTGCFPGCGSTSKVKNTVEVRLADGSTKLMSDVEIKCSGTGLLHCPTTVLQQDEPDAFQAGNTNEQVEYADNQIASGIINGTHTITVLNTDTGVTWRYVVTWSTVAGLETVEVTTEEVI